jgi:ketosteroid isomerase-like protein
MNMMISSENADTSTNVEANKAANNVDAVKTAYEAYKKGDFAPVDSLMAENVVVSGPTATGVFRSLGWEGRKGFRQFAEKIQEDWDHQLYEPVNIQGHGDWVVSLVRVTTMHKRSKAKIDTTMAHALRFKDGKCVEFHEHINGQLMADAAR